MNNTQNLDSIWLIHQELKEMTFATEKVNIDSPLNRFNRFFKDKIDTLKLLNTSTSLKDRKEYEQITYEVQVAFWHFKKSFAA